MAKDKDYRIISDRRKEVFGPTSDFIYEIFKGTSYFCENELYFENNASKIVEELRKIAWDKYLKNEYTFTADCLKEFICEKGEDSENVPIQNVIDNIERIYKLNLSNTQSRRVRAGSEFESILEFVLLWAGIPVDCQGNIGKEGIIDNKLSKQCDLVVPSVYEYLLKKDKGAFISLKTSLRERYAEVADEIKTTGAPVAYLVTLDDNISSDILKKFKTDNIICITSKDNKKKMQSLTEDRIKRQKSVIESNKQKLHKIIDIIGRTTNDSDIDKLNIKRASYEKRIKASEEKVKNYHEKLDLIRMNVYDFEYLIKECKQKMQFWNDNYEYTVNDVNGITSTINIQCEKHRAHVKVFEKYNNRLNVLRNAKN